MMGPAANRRGEVRLADGSRVTIRPVDPGDKPLIAAAFEELSEQSRYRRFFTPQRALDERQLAYLTEVNHHDHEALLAIDGRTGSCAAVARFVRVGAEVAEPAVVVADRWQRRGLGTELIERLAERARSEGIARFSAIVLAENRDAIRLAKRLGEITREDDGGVLHFDVVLLETGAGPTLRELLRAAAGGLLALAHRGWAGNG
jgi:GNAT superfamily N-acetyltransferase